MTKEMTCIACPIGCRMVAEWEEGSAEISITGNRCPRGEEYGREEILAPSRVVTATAFVSSPGARRLPVKTDQPLPKGLIESLLADIYALTLDPPISRGETIIDDYRESGVNVVATATIREGER